MTQGSSNSFSKDSPFTSSPFNDIPEDKEVATVKSISHGLQSVTSSRRKVLTFPWNGNQQQQDSVVPSYVEELEGVADWVKQTRRR
jgi:hypothetical protein